MPPRAQQCKNSRASAMLPRLAGAGPPGKRAAACRAGCARGRRLQHCRQAGSWVPPPSRFIPCVLSSRVGRHMRGSFSWCAPDFPRCQHLCFACVLCTDHQPVTRCRPAVQRTPRTTATLSATRSWKRFSTGAPTARGCPASWGPLAAWSTSTGMPVVLGNHALMEPCYDGM